MTNFTPLLYNVLLISENVLKAFFKQLSEKYKRSTLWSKWSLLKSIINLREGIDITEYQQLQAFLKREKTKNLKFYHRKKLKNLSIKPATKNI